MADPSHSDWLDQWQALSRQGMAAWQDMARGNAAQTPPVATAWPDAEQAARMFSGARGAQGETAERLIEGARNYAAFMQSMLAASAGSAQGGVGPSWNQALRQGFAAMGNEAGAFEHPAVRAWRTLAGQGGSDGFAQMMGAMNALRAPPPDTADLKGWLNLPAFGPLRENQEHYQKTATAWVDYQEQMRRYNALMLDAAQRGFARFEGKLAEHEQPGRQIESMRALYDLWVDASEEGYAEVALSAEFREVYAALVNAQMRVRSQVQQQVERLATDLGMPTRSEINTIGERLQGLRREVRARDADTALADEVAALRAELAALKAARPERGSAPAETRPVAARKAAPPVKAVPGAKRGKTKNAARKASRKPARG